MDLVKKSRRQHLRTDESQHPATHLCTSAQRVAAPCDSPFPLFFAFFFAQISIQKFFLATLYVVLLPLSHKRIARESSIALFFQCLPKPKHLRNLLQCLLTRSQARQPLILALLLLFCLKMCVLIWVVFREQPEAEKGNPGELKKTRVKRLR